MREEAWDRTSSGWALIFACVVGIARGGDYRIGLDLDVHVSSLFELHSSSVIILESIWDSYLAIEMIGTLDRNLGLFRFAGVGLGWNYSFNFPWKRGTGFGFP